MNILRRTIYGKPLLFFLMVLLPVAAGVHVIWWGCVGLLGLPDGQAIIAHSLFIASYVLFMSLGGLSIIAAVRAFMQTSAKSLSPMCGMTSFFAMLYLLGAIYTFLPKSIADDWGSRSNWPSFYFVLGAILGFLLYRAMYKKLGCWLVPDDPRMTQRVVFPKWLLVILSLDISFSLLGLFDLPHLATRLSPVVNGLICLVALIILPVLIYRLGKRWLS